MPLNNPNDPGYGVYSTEQGLVSTAFPQSYRRARYIGRSRPMYGGKVLSAEEEAKRIRASEEAKLQREFKDVEKEELKLANKYSQYMTPEGFVVHKRGTKEMDPLATQRLYQEYQKDYASYQKEYQEASTMWGGLASKYNYQSFDPQERQKQDIKESLSVWRSPTKSERIGGYIGKVEDYSLGGSTYQKDASFLSMGKSLGLGIIASGSLAMYDIGSFGYQMVRHPIQTTKSFFQPETYYEMGEQFQKDPFRLGLGLWGGGKIMGKAQKQVSKRVYTGTEYKVYEDPYIKYKEKGRTPEFIKSTAKMNQRIEATQYQYLDFRTQFGGKLFKYELKDYGKTPAVSKTYTDVGSRINLEISSSGQFGGTLKTNPYLKEVTRPKRTIQQLSGEVIRVSDRGNIRAFVETRSKYVRKGGKDIYRRKGTEGIVDMERIGKFEEYKPYQEPFKGTYYEVTSEMAKVKYDPASLKKLEIGERISQPPKKIVVEKGKPPKPSKRRIITERGKGYKLEIDLDQLKPSPPETTTIQSGKSGLNQLYGTKQISPQKVEAITTGILESARSKLKAPKDTRSQILKTTAPAPLISDTKYQEYGILGLGGLSPQIKQQSQLGIETGLMMPSKEKLFEESQLKTQLKTKGKTKGKAKQGLRMEQILTTIPKIKTKSQIKYMGMQKQRQQLRMKQMQMLKMKPPMGGIGIGFPKMQPPKIPKPFIIKGTGLKKQSKRIKDILGRGKHKRKPRYSPSLTGLILKIKQPKETKKRSFTGLEIRGI